MFVIGVETTTFGYGFLFNSVISCSYIFTDLSKLYIFEFNCETCDSKLDIVLYLLSTYLLYC